MRVHTGEMVYRSFRGHRQHFLGLEGVLVGLDPPFVRFEEPQVEVEEADDPSRLGSPLERPGSESPYTLWMIRFHAGDP